jgi:hypothetical protein
MLRGVKTLFPAPLTAYIGPDRALR